MKNNPLPGLKQQQAKGRLYFMCALLFSYFFTRFICAARRFVNPPGKIFPRAEIFNETH